MNINLWIAKLKFCQQMIDFAILIEKNNYNNISVKQDFMNYLKLICKECIKKENCFEIGKKDKYYSCLCNLLVKGHLLHQNIKHQHQLHKRYHSNNKIMNICHKYYQNYNRHNLLMSKYMRYNSLTNSQNNHYHKLSKLLENIDRKIYNDLDMDYILKCLSLNKNCLYMLCKCLKMCMWHNLINMKSNNYR